MNTKGIVALIALGSSMSLIAAAAHADLVVNGGFEAGIPAGLSLPVDYALWSGDLSEIVTSQDDIIPFEGTEMVHFIFTSPHGPGITTVGGELWQIIDINPYRTLIDSGNALATAEGWFNRVDSDNPNIDTKFSVGLRAYSGDIADFPSMWNNSELARSQGDVYSDSDTRSWEMATTWMMIPVSADFLVYRIDSEENIFNDGVGTEFHGHYGDAFSLVISEVPAPASLVMMLGGALTIGAARRRRTA